LRKWPNGISLLVITAPLLIGAYLAFPVYDDGYMMLFLSLFKRSRISPVIPGYTIKYVLLLQVRNLVDHLHPSSNGA